MKSMFRRPFIAIFPILCFMLVPACQGGLPVTAVVTGTVTKVHDGDSIHITPAGRKRVIVRLAAIDAPEIKQQHGVKSRDYLRSLLLHKPATALCNKLDKYQRQICVVKRDDLDINLEMLAAGQAWYYERFKEEQTRANQRAYKKAETIARKRKLGLWQAEPMPPWTFRSRATP